MNKGPIKQWLGFVLVSALIQPLQAAVIEEIVVTAQKREQNPQDVGIAISALSGEQMQQLGYTNAQQVTAMAPGVQTVQPNGEANYSIAIRGVANSDFTTNVESPVAVYVDDIYISQMSGTGFMLFDMERVEILKGPQGTLYGRNATGGLAHYITNKPSQEMDGYARITAGKESQIRLEGAVGGALSDTLSARLAFATNHHDGYIKNRLTGDDLNDGNEQGYRLQLLWEPSDHFELLLAARGMEQDIDTGLFEHVSSVNDGQLTPTLVNPVLGYIDNDGDPYEGDWDSPGFNDLETRGYSATINWDIGDMTFTSITDYSTVEREYIEDSDASPVRLFNFYLNTDAKQVSQEFRLTGQQGDMDWVVGYYFMDLEVDDSNGAITEGFVDPTSDTPAESGLDNPYVTKTRSVSLFGQIEFPLSDRLTFTGGLRWIQDDKEHDFQVIFADYDPADTGADPIAVAEIASYSGDRKDDEYAFRLGLDLDISDSTMVYASYNRGVKGGGYNAPVFPLSPPLDYDDETMSYDPEKLDAFEVGFKSRLNDGLLQLNGAVYYYDYEDYQAFQIVGIDTLTTNADADAWGGEFEVISAPTAGLELVLGAAYNDIEVDLAGQKTTSVQSPEWNLNALARYEFEVGSGSLAFQWDAVYRSEHFFSLTGLETVEEDGYTVQNVSVMYTPEDGKWNVQAFVHNASDEEYLVQTFDLSGMALFGMTEQYFGRPRWYGATFTYNFN